MAVRLDKPWRGCEAIDRLPGHMGVFELADQTGAVLYVGYAGGRSRFGLRSEIADALGRFPDAALVRYEVTTAYLTRWQELLMAHRADRGALPPGNADVSGLGRLSPG
ncbi:MAG TPA: hypothetical protein VF210_07205 [Pseudomonadales bacterium]